MSDRIAKGYVKVLQGRATGEYLVQIPNNSQWGFALHDDDQCWDGGFNSGASEWILVDRAEVPADVRERLDWLFDLDPEDR